MAQAARHTPSAKAIGGGASSLAELVQRLLGGPKVLGSTPEQPSDYIDLVRHGLPYRSLEAAAEQLAPSFNGFIKSLHLPARSIHRRRGGRLTPFESERLLRRARVSARAAQVLGNMTIALDWLNSANRALEGEKPISLLDTEVGAEEVLQVLGRIEYGVYG